MRQHIVFVFIIFLLVLLPSGYNHSLGQVGYSSSYYEYGHDQAHPKSFQLPIRPGTSFIGHRTMNSSLEPAEGYGPSPRFILPVVFASSGGWGNNKGPLDKGTFFVDMVFDRGQNEGWGWPPTTPSPGWGWPATTPGWGWPPMTTTTPTTTTEATEEPTEEPTTEEPATKKKPTGKQKQKTKSRNKNKTTSSIVPSYFDPSRFPSSVWTPLSQIAENIPQDMNPTAKLNVLKNRWNTFLERLKIRNTQMQSVNIRRPNRPGPVKVTEIAGSNSVIPSSLSGKDFELERLPGWNAPPARNPPKRNNYLSVRYPSQSHFENDRWKPLTVSVKTETPTDYDNNYYYDDYDYNV